VTQTIENTPVWGETYFVKRPQASIMTKLTYIVSSALAMALCGCATPGAKTPNQAQSTIPVQAPVAAQMSLPDVYVDKGIKVTVDGLWKSETGDVLGVSGTAKNVTKRDMKFCSVMLDVLDHDGVKLATAQATVAGLKVGQTWRFQATLSAPYQIKFASIKSGSIIAIPVKKPKSEVSQS
jgi:hypothetical protein